MGASDGGLLADVGRIDEAVELLEPLVRDELANAFAAGALGYCYRKLERWPKRSRSCRPRSISMPVSPGTSRSSTGARRSGRTSDAQEVYRRGPEHRRRRDVGRPQLPDRGRLRAFRLNRLTWAAALLGRATPGDRELPEARRPRPRAAGQRAAAVALDEYNGAIDLLRKHADEARARAMLVSARDDLLQARQEGRLDAHRDAAEHIDAMLREEISRYAVPA